MRNQYQAIGRLIMNLRNGRFLEDEDEIILEASEEFNDITLQLGYYWVEKLEGWEYNMDFHRAEEAIEAGRLSVEKKMDELLPLVRDRQ